MADEKTTISASPELAPLDVRRKNRAQAREEAKAEGAFSHAAELKAIAAAEASGERGLQAAVRRRTLGTAQSEPPADGDSGEGTGEGSSGADAGGENASGDGWGQGGQSSGTPAAAGVTATPPSPPQAPAADATPRPSRRQRANQ